MEDNVLCKLSGTVLEYDVPTRTGKIYSKECIDTALADDVIKEQLDNKSLYAITEFPEGANIDVSTVCGVVTELKSDVTKLTTSIDILNTPKGRIAKKLIDKDNYEIGLLGYGTIEDNKVLSCNIVALSVTGKRDK